MSKVEVVSPLDRNVVFGNDEFTSEVAQSASRIANIKPGVVPMFGLFSQALALQDERSTSQYNAEADEFLPLFHHAIEWIESRNEPVTFERILHASELILVTGRETKLPDMLEEIRFDFSSMKRVIHAAQTSLAVNGMQSDFYKLRLDPPEMR